MVRTRGARYPHWPTVHKDSNEGIPGVGRPRRQNPSVLSSCVELSPEVCFPAGIDMTEQLERMINRPATLVFRTIHIDRAGETSNDVVVQAEIADVDDEGLLLLATRRGIFVHFPAHALFPVTSDRRPSDSTKYIGGRELIRDFHPIGDAPLTKLRWLAPDEVEAALRRKRSRGS